MIVELSFMKVQPSKLDEAMKVRIDQLTPALKRQKGFDRMLLVVSPDALNEGLRIEFWESREALEAWHGSKEYQDILSKLTPLFAEPPTTKLYEVRASSSPLGELREN